MIDYESLQQVLAETLNRGSMHVFLGSPWSDGGDKTTVEPGNVYSPGVWTCGVSVWVNVDDRWFSAERTEGDELDWGFESDVSSTTGRYRFSPVLVAVYDAGPVRITHRLFHEPSGSAAEIGGTDRNIIEVTSHDSGRGVSLFVVVRGLGPAGGTISRIEKVENGESISLAINQNVHLVPETTPDDVVVFPASSDGIGPWAAFRYDAYGTNRDSVSPLRIGFSTRHVFLGVPFGGSAASAGAFSTTAKRDAGGARADAAIAGARGGWGRECPTRIFCPDQTIEAAWNRSAFHILSAMERGIPRIGAVNYPVFWMRDGVIVLRALDMIGRNDLARVGAEYIAPLDHSGGFGAESDGPGEGIWAIVRHARVTNDTEWLARVFPHIERRAALIDEMLHATEPIFAVGENRSPRYMNDPWINLLCLPAENGVIRGRMDWHSPDFYVNCWAYAGLDEAARAASALGKADSASRWEKSAADLLDAIRRELIPSYGNDRDPAVAPYPTGAFCREPVALEPAFSEWYTRNRFDPTGGRIPEQLWTYFEAAQAHNAILLGFTEQAWKSIDGLLAPNRTWDVSAFVEGEAGGNECLPFRNDVGANGWLRPDVALGGNMPHNWTTAEVVNLIRDIFVVEDGEALVLGKGVPARWLLPGSVFGIENAATDFGRCSYTVAVGQDGSARGTYSGPAGFTSAFACDWREAP